MYKKELEVSDKEDIDAVMYEREKYRRAGITDDELILSAMKQREKEDEYELKANNVTDETAIKNSIRQRRRNEQNNRTDRAANDYIIATKLANDVQSESDIQGVIRMLKRRKVSDDDIEYYVELVRVITGIYR